MSRVLRRDLLAAVSLGNLTLLHVWAQLLSFSPADSFYLSHPPPSEYAAAILNVGLLGTMFLALIQLFRWVRDRYGDAWGVPLVLLIAILPVNALRSVLAEYFPLLRSGLFAVAGVKGAMAIYAIAALGVGYILFRWRDRLPHLTIVAVIELAPLVAVEAGTAIVRANQAPPAAFAYKPLSAPLHSTPHGPRIIWVIFDGLDYRLLFEDRPAGVSVPEFEKLREQSLFATAAYSPSTSTIVSVPSLLTGKQLTGAYSTDPETLLVRGQDSPEDRPLGRLDTIFSEIHRRGGNAAAAGWYLPYCRMFSSDLTSCASYDAGNLLNSTGDTLLQKIIGQDRSLLETSLYSPFGLTVLAKHHARIINAIQKDAVRMAADPNLDFVFLHFPVPHTPHTYDRVKRSFTKANSAFAGYADSIALADIILGELREEMTRAGLWDASTILVSADHSYRESRQFDGKRDLRVPFLLKMPGQTADVPFVETLHTIVSKALVESIFAGEVRSPADVVTWLQTRDRSLSAGAGN